MLKIIQIFSKSWIMHIIEPQSSRASLQTSGFKLELNV